MPRIIEGNVSKDFPNVEIVATCSNNTHKNGDKQPAISCFTQYHFIPQEKKQDQLSATLNEAAFHEESNHGHLVIVKIKQEL